MTIILYTNSAPPNKVDKSANLTVVETLEGVLRMPTSIINPTVTIERASPVGFNYIRIPEFNRYYFVTGVSSTANNIVSIAAHVDVLMTYNSQIRQMYAVVRRNEFKYNLYLDDNLFKVYQNSNHKIISWERGFNDFSYVLALAGNSE